MAAEDGRNLDSSSVRDAYRRWAPVYDVVFGKVMEAGRLAAARAASRPGIRLLEVGVGTGIALPAYDPTCRVTGIDLSHEMLLRAARRVAEERLSNVDGLAVMDAARLAFPNAAFDAAVAMFLITVVPDVPGVLAEMERVVRPGGEVVLVNHFAARSGPRAAIERMMAPHARRLGWHPDFPIEAVTGQTRLALVEVRPVRPFGIFTLLRFRKNVA
ncbi:class I SAM-dependent methyltransferase [Propylenella binzhouense]|uniref:Methyltransferase domain-containing protein n=1 Tax=Propylenella binzhouense TaxID=2555902 RepID=A0A964T688_9HYPH|nr:class I SAM-dependent methyltransferase [Propylenella binzhouense]MYZ49243.1 methyltransferase domain-containing protein [Propylenella binzhouense]